MPEVGPGDKPHGGSVGMTSSDIASRPLSEAEHRAQLRRAVIASTVGTTIEWYDFLLYSIVTGLAFGKLFFPESDPLVGVLQAFAIYTVGFIARPIGAAFFGHFGDRIGRKGTLIATLLTTGLATFAVGFVPTYETVGISGDQFLVWGWRVPFMLSIVMVAVGLYIRLGILETPVFRRLVAEERIERVPVLEVIKRQPRQIILSAFARMAEQAPAYIYLAFVFTYGAQVLHTSRDFLLTALIAAGLVSFVTIPLAGHLSDRFGRKRIYLIGSVATGIFGFIYFAMLNTMVPAWIFLGIILSFVPHDLMYGPQAALIAECFTPRLRYSGCSIGYQLASVIAGGPAPLIATALLAATGSGYVIAAYILFCAVVSIVATALMPDLTNRDISQEHA